MKIMAKLRSYFEHWHIIAGLLILYDIVAVNLSYFAALWIRLMARLQTFPRHTGTCLSDLCRSIH